LPSRPSKYLEIVGHLELKRFLERHVDMQFLELRKMFTLRGFNFPIAAYLLSMISGSSVCFYNATKKDLVGHSRRGYRFNGCVKSYYPKEPDLRISRKELSRKLYDLARNPLAHTLGVDIPARGEPWIDAALVKKKLKASEVAQLEDSNTRPSFCPPTIQIRRATQKTIYVISLATLYWGLHRMLHSLFSSRSQARRAERLARTINTFMDAN
jgi:hypothetical protein